jgi:hypothetical protein
MKPPLCESIVSLPPTFFSQGGGAAAKKVDGLFEFSLKLIDPSYLHQKTYWRASVPVPLFKAIF